MAGVGSVKFTAYNPADLSLKSLKFRDTGGRRGRIVRRCLRFLASVQTSTRYVAGLAATEAKVLLKTTSTFSVRKSNSWSVASSVLEGREVHSVGIRSLLDSYWRKRVVLDSFKCLTDLQGHRLHRLESLEGDIAADHMDFDVWFQAVEVKAHEWRIVPFDGAGVLVKLLSIGCN